MSRPFVWSLVTVAVLVLLSCGGLVVPLDVAAALLVGWAFYLARVLPGVTVAWSGVATAAACLVLVSAGSDAMLGWLYGEIRGEGAGRWKAKWTASIVSVVLLMFVAGLAAAGVVHQVGWLLTSEGPAFKSTSLAARRAQSSNNLKQIGLGLAAYEADHGTYPPGGTFDRLGRPLHGWMARILPFLYGSDLHVRIDFSVPWDDPRNREAFQTDMPPYQNPAIDELRQEGTGFAIGHYAGNVLVIGGDEPRGLGDVPDGLANTIMIGEVAAGFEPWGSPTNWRDPGLGINQSPKGFGSPFPGGANLLFGDGSVHFVRDSVDPRVLDALGTPDGGEEIPRDRY
jgi:prepilin-type processing-associated H-X9-DG protein